MSTVPKLNYANLRNNKSKSKQNDLDPKMQSSSNELFEHMNQQNIKYIHSQIKQKQRKNNQIKLKRKSEEDVGAVGDIGKYPEEISEKESRLEETERGGTGVEVGDIGVKVMKTDGESVKSISCHQRELGPSKKVSEEAELHKLSYYDLVSQAKSKRVSSIEAGFQQDQISTHKQTGQFLNFLTGYIDDLNQVQLKNQRKKFTKIKSKSQMDKTRNKDKEKQRQRERQRQRQRERQRQRQRDKVNSITISSASEREILKNRLAEEKVHNIYLAKKIEEQRIQESDHKKRIENLQDIVTKLAEQMQYLRQKLYQKKPLIQKPQIENIYEPKPQPNHLSHRKNQTSFSLLSNQYRPYKNSRKVYNQEIYNLVKQYQFFNETGECTLRGKDQRVQY